MNNSRSIIQLSYILVFFLFCISQLLAQEKEGLPNIVYILADDLGYGDVSVYNIGSKLLTPNIDRLSNQGIRFTDAHSTSSVCTPSRYSILTGRYPWRSRLPIGVLHGYSRTLIEPDLPTVANLLKTKSYQTAIVGKWHLGLDWVPKDAFMDSLKPDYNKNNLYGIIKDMNPEHIDFSKKPSAGPNTQGFDYSFIIPASLDMAPYCYLENNKLLEPLSSFTKGNNPESGFTGPFWREGLMSPSFNFYDVLPILTTKANDFIRKQTENKNPFFLYFPMPAPHTPWVTSDEFKGKSKVGEYGDYVLEMDAAVGKILYVLDSMGFSKNTIVFFSSDNGPYWKNESVEQFNHQAAGPFRGMKGDVYEGGHRIPLIIRYPNKIKAGSISNTPTTLANLMATCAELIGDQSEKFVTEDSYSILPILFGKSQSALQQKAIVNISSIGTFNITKDGWKLITKLGSGGFTRPAEIKAKPGEPIGQLYNLSHDIHEDHNLYAEYPGKVRELMDLLEKIQKAPKGQYFN